MKFAVEVHAILKLFLFLQGSTIPSNSKVVVHWSKAFESKKNAGMAYVSLGRTEELKDIFIKGKVDVKGIHASTDALEETRRLQTIFDQRVEKLTVQKDKFWKISYLNVRNGIKCHYKDIAIDNFITTADIFALGETCLEENETVTFDGYKEYFASHGPGKGVAVFSKMECTNRPVVHLVTSSIFSAIHIRTSGFDAIFLYWSSGCRAEEVTEILSLLDTWIVKHRPTTIMGDVNMNFSEDCKLNKFLEERGFLQLIQTSTYESGSLIDHIYANEPLRNLNISTEQCSAYYSDHDIITIHIPK